MQNLIITKKHAYFENQQREIVISDPLGRAWIEVQPSAIQANASVLKNLIGVNKLFLARLLEISY